jgi:hypothetical protein
MLRILRIISNDDIVHVASHQDMYGLKKTQNVRDNCTGFTLHTLVYAAIGLPGTQWEYCSVASTIAASERLSLSLSVCGPSH